MGVHECYKKYVLVPAEKAANKVVVVLRLQYFNSFKQGLSRTKAYKESAEEERSVDLWHCLDRCLKISIYIRRGAISAISFRSDPISLCNCVINML